MSSDVIALSCITYKKMMQNLVWATPYNVIAIPAAAGAFVRWGITLPMSIGALAMNLSTVILAVERAVSTPFQTLTLLTMI
jgi:Cu2+-exporting ATPase